MKEIIHIYDSGSQKPGRLLKIMLHDLVKSLGLATRLLIRNINIQYRQTVLGYLWAFLPPLVMTVVWVYLASIKVLNISSTNIPYLLYVLTGLVFWQTFVDAINMPLKIFNESRAMISKINFPHEALFLAGFGEVLFNFLVRFLLLIPVFIYLKFVPADTAILVPVGVLSIIGLGMMIGILLVPPGVLFQDINRGLIIILQLWFFLTPVIYPVPDKSAVFNLIALNPVTPIIEISRNALTNGDLSYLPAFIFVTALTFILIITGWIIYRIALPHLIARIGA